jgi:hypothetical protein
MTKKNISWANGVRANLMEKPPTGWIVLNGIKGSGVQMLPEDDAYLTRNGTGVDLKLVGSYRLVFEFFRLDTSGDIKLSARVAGIEGQPMFHEFWGIARCFGCPAPKGTKKKDTQSVAAWPGNEKRLSFAATNHAGMADWVREFFANPPVDFVLFVAGARNLIASS